VGTSLRNIDNCFIKSSLGITAASEWSELGSRDMDCIGRMVVMRLSEWE
jgi:hypothetical protein